MDRTRACGGHELGKCTTDGDSSDAGTDLAAYGYDQGGNRVELSFTHQSAGESPSDQPVYYGVLTTLDGHWQVQTSEPGPWLDGDRSRVSGSATMEDSGGQTVEVNYVGRCP
ncbi:MAG: hypothetical protein WB239_08520 [Acidimicrobiia bacterium]